ncbi:MAG: His-Xaa-Ser system radical SAM maturase HxsB [Polyangia bacterium]|jgi:His-Xaa-Ser system radical SAM maturase HxsB|nr:His-Xaa-Ser system radical SAM maturase HxsB [Polyangia bacterium]
MSKSVKKAPLTQIKNAAVAPFRFRKLAGDRLLITNDSGAYARLTAEELDAFLRGSLDPSSPLAAELEDKGFVLTPESEARLIEQIRLRSEHLFQGPLLHIVITTLRCNQKCRYCHASRKGMSAGGWDMTPETARKVVDVIFQSPSPRLTIEFQGGEPLVNFPVVRQIVEDAYGRADATGRHVEFTLVSNLSLLDEEKLAFLVDNGVMICTSLDGPKPLHDKNRPMADGSSYDETLRWMGRINALYRERGMDPSLAYVNALATISRATLKDPKGLVDEYRKLGFKAIHLRPLNPFGFGEKVWAREGYSAEEFLAFYREALDYIVGLNKEGVEIQEKTASLFLTRILTAQNPNYMDLRSPCGAGIGQLAYNFDGRVYLCDEGRMVSAMGEDLFCIGHVGEQTYEEIIRHESVGSLCLASCLECLPGCSDCAYNPYCGVCPVYNYQMQGDLFAVQPESERCRIQMGIQDMLFELLLEGGPGMLELLERWTIERDRSQVYRRL